MFDAGFLVVLRTEPLALKLEPTDEILGSGLVVVGEPVMMCFKAMFASPFRRVVPGRRGKLVAAVGFAVISDSVIHVS